MSDKSNLDIVYVDALARGLDTNNPYLNSKEDLLRYGGELRWGTFCLRGAQKVEWKLVRDLNNSHIRAILITQPHVDRFLKAVMLAVFETRLLGGEVNLDEPEVEITVEEALVNTLMGEDRAELVY